VYERLAGFWKTSGKKFPDEISRRGYIVRLVMLRDFFGGIERGNTDRRHRNAVVVSALLVGVGC